jgi:hypothetical protein
LSFPSFLPSFPFLFSLPCFIRLLPVAGIDMELPQAFQLTSESYRKVRRQK